MIINSVRKSKILISKIVELLCRNKLTVLIIFVVLSYSGRRFRSDCPRVYLFLLRGSKRFVFPLLIFSN